MEKGILAGEFLWQKWSEAISQGLPELPNGRQG